MLRRGQSKERGSRKVTPPSPSYMTNDQFAAYLTDLRNNRVARPGGARPLPSSSRRDSGHTIASSIADAAPSDASPAPVPVPRKQESRLSSGRPSMTGSVASRYSSLSQSRDYNPQDPTVPLKPGEVVPSATYIERGQRWMEKEEVVSLRHAMEDMNTKNDAASTGDEGDTLYHAALNEASELVWQHENPSAQPQPGAPYRYRPHLRKDSYAHARTASVSRCRDESAATGLARASSPHSTSRSSTDSERLTFQRGRPSGSSVADRDQDPNGARSSLDQARGGSMDPARSKPYGSISSAYSVAMPGRRRSSMKRNISGEIEKPFSGDQIWEEPEGSSPGRHHPQSAQPSTQPLKLKPRNPLNRVQFAPESSGAAAPESQTTKMVSRFEIHRNPPSQSRNPQYVTNGRSEVRPEPPTVPRKHGVEIRSDDIRQATSMRLKDRSTKLPTPTAVSDTPGRPIVSFDANWKAPEEATDQRPEESGRGPFGCGREFEAKSQTVPSISVTEDSAVTPSSSRPLPPPSIQVSSERAPRIPTIAVSDAAQTNAMPSIVVPDGDSKPSIPSMVLPGEDEMGNDESPSVPIIVTPDSQSDGSSSRRPLPNPQTQSSRPRPRPRPKSHWSPAAAPGSRATARCHECGLPIEGRFVALAGSPERFHPQCFSCYACGTSLEALEISPEPDQYRNARLNRIRRRAQGELLEEAPGQTMAEDGDDRLRFYCHLDWHELFAPRCKHCKTPILGEHIVALGEHWHYGHFFCAECGDPFGQSMTHIEKDGYAWCINCQTKRTERRAPKCRKCRTAVIGQYIRALGGEWHDECFRCATCHGGFDDGQIFPRDKAEGTVVLCTRCREIELKA